VLAFALHQRGKGGSASPWDGARGFRLGTAGQRRWSFRNEGADVDVAVSYQGEAVRIDIGGAAAVASGALDAQGALTATVDGAPVFTRARLQGGVVHLFLAGAHHAFEWRDPYLPPGEVAERHGGLVAPMPGRILAILAGEGDKVARGVPLIVMEAMKMEHTVTAPAAGVVEKVLCAIGDQVKEGVELLRLS
jgi:3-methylcrotonyl-CoA carboxylase alpha subunit